MRGKEQFVKDRHVTLQL